MKKFLLTAFASTMVLFGVKAQTTLISPTGDGGFENGSTFAANNWSVTSGSQVNQWVVSTNATAGFTGSNCAYVSDSYSTTTTHSYNVNSSSVVHFYKDITVPAGETNIQLSFNWLCDGEGTAFDRMRIWLVPAAFTPTAGTQVTSTGTAPSGRVQVGLTNYNLQPTWANASVIIPAAYAGNSFRLIFEWRNDGSSGTMPPAGIDNIKLTSSSCGLAPTALNTSTITSSSANFTWTPGGTEASWDVYYGSSPLTPPTASTIPTATTSVASYSATGLMTYTGYSVYVRANCGGGIYSPWTAVKTFTTVCLPPNVTSTSSGSICGVGNATLNATSDPGVPLNWYTASTGGSAVSNSSVFVTPTISSTTLYYVSAGPVGCESSRSTVTASVVVPDAITASASATNLCVGGTNTVNLSAAQTGTNGNVYSYTWNASPVAGSGMPSPVNGATTSVSLTAAGNYVYMVTATDGTCTAVSSVNVAVNNLPSITANATPSTVCSGALVNLNATTPIVSSGTLAIGTATTLTGATSQPTAFCNRWSSYRMQTVYTAAELNAAGLRAGNITSIAYRITTLGDAGNNTNYTVKCGTTTATSFTDFISSAGFTTVFNPATYNHVVGLNTITFNTPYFWDGVSNLVIEVSHNGANLTNNSQTYYTLTPGNTVAWSTNGGSTGTPSANRLNIVIGGQISTQGAGSCTWQWNPGAINSNTANINPVNTGSVAANQSYTIAATNTITGCSNTSTVNVLVNPLPTAPVASNSSQCGVGVSTASVSGGTTYNWYATPTSTTVLQTGTSSNYTTSIGSTTTWYVTSVVGACESSPRTAVTTTVSLPDAVTANTSAANLCVGGANTITLTAVQTGTNGNVYTFTWSASPAAGSGLTGSPTGTMITVTPTATGIYNYSVTATDGFCTTVSSVSVSLSNPPSISAMATPTAICSGSPVNLNAQSINASTSTATVGTGATTGTTYDAIFYHLFGGNKTQQIIRASELTAAGLVAGNLNSLSINIPSGGMTYSGLAVSIATTTNTDMSAGINNTASFTTVYTNPAYTTLSGINTFNFGSAFNWDGTSNLIVQFCWSNNNTGGTSNFASVVTTAYVSTAYYRADSQSASTICGGTTATSTTSKRALYMFNGQVGTNVSSSMNFVWNPGAINSNTAVVNPVNTGSVAATQVYTVTVTNPSTSCSNTATVGVIVNPLPSSVVASNNSQCGIGVPTASVSGGTSYNWYATPTSTTVLQSGSSANYTNSINSTTTWYISSSDGTCESPRVALTQTVNAPPALTLNAPSICQSSSSAVSLSVTSTVGSYDTYSWSPTANLYTDPAGTIAYTGENTAVVYVKSATPGILNYTASATNSVSGCANTATTSVQVDAVPSAPTSTMSSLSVCQGVSTASINATASGTLVASFGSNLISTGTGASTFAVNVPALPAGASIISTKLNITNAQAVNGSWMSEIRVALSGATTLTATQISTSNSAGTVTPNPSIAIPNLPLAGGTVTLALTESYDDSGVDDAIFGNVTIAIGYTMPGSAISWWDAATSGTLQGTGSPFETVGTPLLPTTSTSGTYTFFAQTNAGACVSATRLPISVIINPVLVSLNPVNVNCNGGNDGSFTLGTVTCGASPFSYGVNGGAFGPIPTNLSAGTYTIIVKDSNGDNSAPIVLTITEPSWTIPNATGTNTAVCTGVPSATIGATSNLTGMVVTQTLTLGTSVSLPGSGQVVLNSSPVSLPAGATVNSTSLVFQNVTTTSLTYPSDIDASISGAVSLPATAISTVNAVVTNAGPYTLTIPNISNGVASVTLINNYTGPATFGTVSIVYSYIQPATINWYTASTGGTLIATSNTLETVGTSVLPNTTTPGVYNFYAEAVYGPCTSAARTLVTVTVNPTPTVSAIASNTVICSGTPVTFTASGAASYSWSPAGGTSATTTVSPSSNTTYTVVGTSLGCSSSATLDLVVNTTPTVTATASSTLICSGSANSVTLTASSTTANYSWAPSGGTSAVEIVTPTVSTVYTVTSANGSCVATKTINVDVNTSPTLTLAATTSSMCSGSTATLTATGATNYTWSPSGDLTASSVVTPAATTIYTVTGESLGCATTGTINLDVVATPTITAMASPTAICSGTNAVLTASSTTSDYSWAPAGGTSDIAIVSPSVSTVYTVTSANGVCVSSATVNLTVLYAPTLTVTPLNATACSGGSVTLTASGADTYTWSNGGGNAATAVFSPTAMTTYTVDGSNACGTASATASVNIDMPITLSAATSNSMICIGLQSSTLTASGTATSFTWMPGSANTSSIVVSPTVTTVYTVSSSNACGVVTSTVTQNAQDCTGLEELSSAGISVFPNPARDVVTFVIPSDLVGQVKLEMYDAIGKLVAQEELTKESTSLRIAKLEEGIYIFKLISNNGQVKIGKVIKY